MSERGRFRLWSMIGITLLVALPCSCAPRSLTLDDWRQATGGAKVDNLCQQPGVKITSNMYAMAGLFDGSQTVIRYVAKPYSMVLTWPQPVTFNTNTVLWGADNFDYGTDFGLEYWDEAKGGYVLAYEEKANTSKLSIHSFDPITTSKIRFTIFTCKTPSIALSIARFQIANVPGASQQ